MAPKPGTRSYGDCHFDPGGGYLWLAASVSSEVCEVSLVETESWSVVHREVVADEFGGSSRSFHPTGKPGLVSLWIAAGQDGQLVRWVRRMGSTFSITPVDELENCIPPVFSPDGSEFLVPTNENSIRRYCRGDGAHVRGCWVVDMLLGEE